MSKKRNTPHLSRSAAVGQGIIRIFLVLWRVTVAFPVIWVLYTSLKSNQEFFASPWALPKTPQWGNFVDAWKEASFGSYFFNSLFTVVLTLVITLLIVGANAYVIAKYNNRFIKASVLLLHLA